ncbi:hypothetical protein L226DRAFT_546001 [Lentinus tigrinus ALCF2SS1-7]|uniref:Glycosyltransferase family 1 protein n=1 Tax=Lentinus tigrinus ALCF2SS1-6 TaxID=1328759 RepID=A0A5C2SFS0_9APHY|nr:hypothetical protein L227DRAFT_499333 [Lentinus tigrinus ALCF2SS1-6]RPD74606.1 hypothetical protein L226DRAFT_546001 [Lentinus tigrinus ALCF2SS1-7]
MDSEDPPGRIHVFAQPFPYGFQEVVEDLHLWKHQGVRAEHETFIDFLNSETGDGGVDLIVLGTCQYDLPYWYDALKDAWDRRDADHKFSIVCYVHNARDMEWQRWIPYWAQRNAIRLLAIGDHVAKAFRDKFAEAADSRDPSLFAADFEHVPVDVHIPVLDIPNLPVKEAPRHLVRAVIQGKFEIERRDYVRIFQELIESLYEDPAAWGYHPLEDRTAFEPNHESAIPPFQLLLVGSQYLGVPGELENVVVVHRDLPYKEFYNLIANSDIVLPAFADNSYYEIRASSTVALATELNVPMLVTNRTRRTYGFIDDDRIVVTRPAAMSEVQALKALRTGDAFPFFASDPAGTGLTMGEIPAVRAGVEEMMRKGWVKSRSEWVQWREWLWQQNREVAEHILRDIP